MDLNQVIAEILQAYLFPILLIAFGVFLFVIGVASLDERANGDRGPIKIGPITFPSPVLPRWLRFALMIGGIVLMVIGLGYILIEGERPQPSTVSPSLISLSYIAEDWDPHLVDMRSASSSGIPVSAGDSLQLFDLWISVPEDVPQHTVQAEIYAGDERIGYTERVALIADKAYPGLAQLGKVTIEKYNHATVLEAWRVQAAWKDLEVVLATYHNDQLVASTRTAVRLDVKGKAWLVAPPNADFASIVYQVNDGPPLVLDLRDAETAGLGTNPGDRLALLEVWYSSNASGGNRDMIQFEGYLSSGTFDRSTLQGSKLSILEQGTHKLAGFTPMIWTIPDGKDYLVATLFRNDRAIMKRLMLPLSLPNGSGLVRQSESVLWPFDQANYVDFESPADLDEWIGTETTTLAQSSDYSFTGNYALAVTTNEVGEALFTYWQHPFQAEVIVGQVYWPRQRGVRLPYAQACAWKCVSIPLEFDRWNTFVMDLSEITFEDKPLNTIEFSKMWIQGQVEGTVPYTFYVDGIQLYPVYEP
jgi:hypothetical protein